MYEQPNSVLDQQSNSGMYQPPNFFTNQHDSPSQSQLLQVTIRSYMFWVKHEELFHIDLSIPYIGTANPWYVPRVGIKHNSIEAGNQK